MKLFVFVDVNLHYNLLL